MTEEIRKRITGFEKHKLGDINHNPRNWKIHTEQGKESLIGTVNQIGFAGVPLVYHSERTGGLTFADGHRRKETFPDLEVDVAMTDLSDEEVDILLMTYDPLAEEMEPNFEKLNVLMGTAKVDQPGLQSFLGRLADKHQLFFDNPDPPDEFPEFDDDIKTEHQCPKCGYEWSGDSR